MRPPRTPGDAGRLVPPRYGWARPGGVWPGFCWVRFGRGDVSRAGFSRSGLEWMRAGRAGVGRASSGLAWVGRAEVGQARFGRARAGWAGLDGRGGQASWFLRRFAFNWQICAQPCCTFFKQICEVWIWNSSFFSSFDSVFSLSWFLSKMYHWCHLL